MVFITQGRYAKDAIEEAACLVSMVIDPAPAGSDAAKFIKNRVAVHQEHIQTIWNEFDGSVRAVVFLFETEVRGLPMLHRLWDVMFAADATVAASRASVRFPRHIGASG